MARISRRKKFVSVAVVAGMLAIGIEMVDPPALSAATNATADLNCSGIKGDNASALGDSAATIGALGAFPPLKVNFSIDAPAKVKAKSGKYPVNIGITVTLPDDLVDKAVSLLGKDRFDIQNSTFSIDVKGPVNSTISNTVASTPVSLTSKPVQVHQSLSGEIDSTTPGLYRFTPGAARFTIAINATSPIVVHSITVECSAGGTLATTNVQIPGAPIIPDAGFIGYTNPGIFSLLNIAGTPLITPDNGNPINYGSLRVVGVSPGGNALISNGHIVFWSSQPGLYEVQAELCANSLPVPMVPGKDEVQQFAWDKTTYAGVPLNAHPLGFTLKFNGEETGAISTSSIDFFGQKIPTPMYGDTVSNLLSTFTIPAASTIQAALEALPSIGSGNVKVKTNEKGYEIDFVGKLARADVGQVEIGQWFTWLDQETKKNVDELQKKLTAPPEAGTGPTTTAGPKLTIDDINAKLAAGILTGAYTIDNWMADLNAMLPGMIIDGIGITTLAGFVAAIFPVKPAMTTPTPGEADIPATETGPLCSGFTNQFAVFPAPPPPAPVQVQGIAQTRSTKSRCYTRTVKVRSHGRTRYVKRRVCPKPAKKKVAKRSTKKTYRRR